MKNKIIRYIDYIFAFIVVCDLALSGLVASIGLPTLSDYFEGWNLIGLITQILLYFSLGIAVVITFSLHHRTAKWFLLALVAVIFIAGQINWTPNTEFAHSQYKQILSNMETRDLIENMEVVSSSAKLYTHPNWFIKILYLVGLVYAFILRTLYNKSMERDAQ